MPGRLRSAILTCLVAAAAGLAGCSSDAGIVPPPVDGSVSKDADFSKCQDTPAVIYMPGTAVTATSTSGLWVAALVSVQSDGPPPLDSPQIGLNTWVFSVTDAATGAPAQITVISERPWMPLHNHGQSTTPVVTPGDPGNYAISGIDPFQAGWWQIKLDLPPVDGVDDKVTFDICVPS